MIEIDINCDVGEGVGNEGELMPLISSCNIACGGHAGDENTMLSTIRLAKENKVNIGAHPSYPDRENFGRFAMDIPSKDLIFAIKVQLSTFTKILQHENGQLHHIKPHGALYNDIAKDEELATVFLDAVEEYKDAPLYVPFNSVIEKEAKKRDFLVLLEAFADRNYTNDLNLVSRKEENALIENPAKVFAHIERMVKQGSVLTVGGNVKTIKADTYCVHGDTPSALKILMYLMHELPKHSIRIKK